MFDLHDSDAFPLISTLEESAIDIKYFPQSELPSAFKVLQKQKLIPLLLIEHFHEDHDFSKQNPKDYELFGLNNALIHLHSGLNSIGDKQCELWVGNSDWEFGQKSLLNDVELSFCSNAHSLIGSLSISLASESSLQELSRLYYEEIIEFISSHNKPNLLRMWNYFPDINHLDSGLGSSLERYQEFCIGRHNAFASGTKADFDYPAASAVGSSSQLGSPTMVILFIATSQPGLFLENPDQVSAYQYPSQYSPKSPSFARASICQTKKLQQLHISGTASIVGHESKYHGDIVNQAHQTIKNLKRLIQHSNEQFETKETFKLNNSAAGAPIIKVYLRNSQDKETIEPIIKDFSPDSKNICYLQADVCRQELDIEIEMLLNAYLV